MNEILDLPQREIDERYIEYCGLGPRLGALIIDAIIVGIVTRVVNVVILEVSYDITINLITSIVVTLAAYLYYPLMEGASGATLGKKALKMVVINKKFEVISYQQSFLRSIIRFLSILISVGVMLGILLGLDGLLSDDGLNSTYIIGGAVIALFLMDLVVMLGDSKYQSLHDKIAGTYVVKASSVQHWGE